MKSPFLSVAAALAALIASPIVYAAQSPQPIAAGGAAAVPAAPAPLVRFEAMNPGNNAGGGDRLSTPRRIAAAVIAQDNPAPKLIVDVGSFTGEFLEAFLEHFPAARGQWTEPVENNRVTAVRRLGRFGERVDYRIGCPARDIAAGCVPAGVDVLITSWLSIHQDLAGIGRYYKNAAERLPSGGWVVNLDHVGFAGSSFEKRLQSARTGFHAEREGPPIHHKDWIVPTLADHLAALQAAGINDTEIVWRSFNTVLIMGRKR